MAKSKIKTYNKSIAAAATAESLQIDNGPTRAQEILLKASDGNSADDMLVGTSDEQTFPVPKGEVTKLSQLIAAAGGAGEYDLSEIFIKAGTNGDEVHVLVMF
jgi:hypothetical protein